MAYQNESENLFYYDIFPRVIAAGRETQVRIRAMGGRKKFEPGKTYCIRLLGHAGGYAMFYPESADMSEQFVTCDEQGGFTFTVTLGHEQEYSVRIEDPEIPQKIGFKEVDTFRVYCVEGDLIGRYPFMGDLHVHSNLSDGRETPELVCANYRQYGYDFMAITDHHRYYPSLRAMEVFKDAAIDLTLVPGEEVQMPGQDDNLIYPHAVNFGGTYSVNALVEGKHTDEVGTDIAKRSIVPDCPPVMTQEAFWKIIREEAEKIEVPEGVNRIQAAGMKWVYDQIRKAGGLAIYPHPNWIVNSVYHVPDSMHDYLVENKMFDAFEVLGGERYYEQNGFQTVRYYQDQAKGYRYPVVGSTDTHGSYPNNLKGFICETIVFANENQRQQLIDAVKGFYSVAVDTISKEFRLVGDARLVRYGCFLLQNYFPLHDELCYEEGRLMRQYALGTAEEKEEAAAMLKAIHGRMERLRKKYFAF